MKKQCGYGDGKRSMVVQTGTDTEAQKHIVCSLSLFLSTANKEKTSNTAQHYKVIEVLASIDIRQQENTMYQHRTN